MGFFILRLAPTALCRGFYPQPIEQVVYCMYECNECKTPFIAPAAKILLGTRFRKPAGTRVSPRRSTRNQEVFASLQSVKVNNRHTPLTLLHIT